MAKAPEIHGRIYAVTEKFVVVHVDGSMHRRPEIHCGRLVFDIAFWKAGGDALLGFPVSDPEELLKLLPAEVPAGEVSLA